MYIIAKQKIDYKNKLVKEARDAFIALGGSQDLQGTISTKKIQEILKGEFELSDDLEVIIIIYKINRKLYVKSLKIKKK